MQQVRADDDGRTVAGAFQDGVLHPPDAQRVKAGALPTGLVSSDSFARPFAVTGLAVISMTPPPMSTAVPERVENTAGFIEEAVIGPPVRFSSVPAATVGAGSYGRTLRARIPGIDVVEIPAPALVPLVEAGNVFLPHPDYAPWVNDFIEECVQFPNGAHDDQVDAMTQAILRWNEPQEVTYTLYMVDPVQISPY